MRFLQTRETPTASISTMNISRDVIVADVVHNDEDCGDANETSSRTANDGPSKSKKRKAGDRPEELVKLATKRLRQSQDDCDTVAAAWAVELRKMDPQQQMFAEKAINDIIFEGQMGLHRNSEEINASCVSTPYSVHPSLHSVITMIQQNPTPKTQERFSLLFNKTVISFQIHIYLL